MKKIYFAFALVAAGYLSFVFTQSFIAHAQIFPMTLVTTTNEQPIVITPQAFGGGTVGVSYSEAVSASTTETSTTAATGLQPLTWMVTAGTLPPGLSLVTSTTGTGVLAGTPTTAGSYPFSLDATNGITATTQMYDFVVNGSSTTTSTSPVMTTTSSATTTTVASPTSPTSTLELELTGLETELAQLEVLAGNSTSGASAGNTIAVPPGPVFGRDLTIGSSGADVLALQQFLNQNGYPVASSGPGSAGEETDYFGPLTQAALAQWQAANNISPAAGYYGPVTRAKISLSSNTSASSSSSSASN
jgi:Putative peptidoglycan binding domain